MLYNHYEHRVPELVLNKSGTINLENKSILTIRFEVDYNSMTEDELKKIIKDMNKQFISSTLCITYNGKDNYKMENLTYIPIEDEHGNKDYLKIKSENNSSNFKMIKKNIDVFKENKKVLSTEINHEKNIEFELQDGNYIFKCNIYDIEENLIKSTDINVNLKTNYYSMNDNKSKPSEIVFDDTEGNFKIGLSANTKKLYSFIINDITSENDNIFEIFYYNPNDKAPIEKAHIGSEISLLNNKQIEEITKHPEMEVLIKPEIIFNINEILTTKHSNEDIGVLRIPTAKSKIRDTYSRYYDLKCDVSQSYTVDLPKTKDFLVTDKFNKSPLFFKTIITDKFDKIKIIDSDNQEIDDYILETLFENIKILYFNPLRNKQYYFSLDNGPFRLIEFKKSYESFFIKYENTNSISFENPVYFFDLMIKGNNEICEIEIVFDDYSKKKLKINCVNKEFIFLEDERIKIKNKILSIKINSSKKDFTIINMISNFKNNRTTYSFFKSNNQDFVYTAKYIDKLNINDIPFKEVSNFKLNKNYIYLDNELKEISNGPLYLEPIKKQDIIFTDIEEWFNEYLVSKNDKIVTGVKDKFFLENIINTSREIVYENK